MVILRAMAEVMRMTQVIIALLALTVVVSDSTAQRIGDRLQIALPLLALACQPSPTAAKEFLLRYGVMFTAAHASKEGLGGSALNRRPDGGRNGFPSAHTSTAVLGASALLRDCVAKSAVAQGVVLFAATFVGASRIDAGRHDIWQVFAGAALGLGCDRALRKPGAARDRVIRGLRTVRRWVVQGLRPALRLARG